MMIPPDKCGLIIGKGGNTLKTMMQEHSVKLHLVQVSCHWPLLKIELFLGFRRNHKRRETAKNYWYQAAGMSSSF